MSITIPNINNYYNVSIKYSITAYAVSEGKWCYVQYKYSNIGGGFNNILPNYTSSTNTTITKYISELRDLPDPNTTNIQRSESIDLTIRFYHDAESRSSRCYVNNVYLYGIFQSPYPTVIPTGYPTSSPGGGVGNGDGDGGNDDDDDETSDNSSNNNNSSTVVATAIGVTVGVMCCCCLIVSGIVYFCFCHKNEQIQENLHKKMLDFKHGLAIGLASNASPSPAEENENENENKKVKERFGAARMGSKLKGNVKINMVNSNIASNNANSVINSFNNNKVRVNKGKYFHVAAKSETYDMEKNNNHNNNSNNMSNEKEEKQQSLITLGDSEELISKIGTIMDSNVASWILVLIEINDLKKLNEVNHNAGDQAINTLKQHVLDFVKHSPEILIGFQENRKGKNGRFAILMNCRKNSELAVRNMRNFSNDICSTHKWNISYGMSFVVKMDKNDSQARFQCYKMAQDSLILNKKLSMNINQDMGDKNFEHVEMRFDMYDRRMSMQKRNPYYSKSLEQKESYKKQLNQLANNKSSKNEGHWVLAAIDADDFGLLRKSNPKGAAVAMKLLQDEIMKICDKYGDKTIGYQRGDDEFSIFIDISSDNNEKKKNKNNDNNNNNNNTNNVQLNLEFAQRVINELISNVEDETETTISAGLTMLSEDKDEFGYEWEDRAEAALNTAKKNGKNKLWWNN